MPEICVGSIKVFLGQPPAAGQFDAVVVVLLSCGKLVLVRNEQRAWEFPGGHREGDESYEETAGREVYEEAGARIKDVECLGYYATQAGKVTVITCAEVSSFDGLAGEYETSSVGLFEGLPSALSFGDGREQLFLDHATALRSSRRPSAGQ